MAENIVSVYDAVTEAIERIHENRSFFTRKVRDILHLVYRKSEETHAGSGISMVGSFLFLRFICPALLSPKAYDIIDYDISADVLRGLVLVVKILQNVVNGVEFDGTKEQYMVCMNTLVTTYHKELQSDIKYILDEDNKPVRRSKQITSSYEAQHAPKDAYLTLSLYYYDYAKSIFGVLVTETRKKEFAKLLPHITFTGSPRDEDSSRDDCVFSGDYDDIDELERSESILSGHFEWDETK